MSSCSNQIGSGEARIEARDAEREAREEEEERERLNAMTENQLYEKLLLKYKDYYGDKDGIKRLNNLGNRGKDKYIKEISEWKTLYNRAKRFLAGARKEKKLKGSKKKGHSKKGHSKKGHSKKGSKKKAKKHVGGGKSRKPKKAKQTRKRPKRSRSRRPKKMKRSKRAGAGDNPYPRMFNSNIRGGNPYDTYEK